jgi:hypothetical protein
MVYRGRMRREDGYRYNIREYTSVCTLDSKRVYDNMEE